MANDDPRIPGREFAKALEAAGIVSDLDTIERIVIDVRPDRVDIHVQRAGTKRLLGVAPLLADWEPVKVTRYWVLISDEVMATPDIQWPAGLQPVERGASEHPGMRWWLFEDDDAPPELDGKKVELAISRGRVTEDGPDLPPHITERRVIG
jgi:hypothetical protein